MPPKLAPSSQSPPLRRSSRVSNPTTSAPSTTSANASDRDLLRQIADLNAEKQHLLDELNAEKRHRARQRLAHEKQTEAMKAELDAKEERLRTVGQVLEALERMDREQAEEEGWDVAEDGDVDGEGNGDGGGYREGVKWRR
jgi:uncharacterized protein YaiL (DUF2058 family)